MLTTVLPDPLSSQDCPVLPPQSSIFHFKGKAIKPAAMWEKGLARPGEKAVSKPTHF